jgi:2-amino-4-hydroxy-6-hydroxymethyldihydropteridine diphosphokinase
MFSQIKQSINNLLLFLNVKFVEWFPFYQQIRMEFGYSTEKDQMAADMLSKMIKSKALQVSNIQKKIQGKEVLVIGAGPSLEKNIEFITKNKKYIKIAANGVVEILLNKKIRPDIVVSDLDGNPKFLRMAEKLGATMVIHAHGDNIESMEKNVPKFRKIIGTTQVMPTENVYNFGGFTDGDRSVFMAEEMRAKSITLIGMDFDNKPRKFSAKDNDVNIDLKRKKLRTAKRLLEMLGKQSKSKLINKSDTKIRGIKSQP